MDTENGPRAGLPPLWTKPDRAGNIQPGKVSERTLLTSFNIQTRLIEKIGRLITRTCNTRTRDNGFKEKEGRFRLDARNKCFGFFHCEDGEVLEQATEKYWLSHYSKC